MSCESLERNRQRLQECHPVFRSALALVLARMQALGYRPRIQDAWRSEEAQAEALASGHSDVVWGFHNATGTDGTPEALAADVIDDDHPLNSGRDYQVALARAARREGLRTGITWGLPAPIKAALKAAIANDEGIYSGRIGWDGTHVEIASLTIAQAHRGQRPSSV